MFGGFGIFCDGKMFGIVDAKGNCYLKADETTFPDFEAHNSENMSILHIMLFPKVFLHAKKP